MDSKIEQTAVLKVLIQNQTTWLSTEEIAKQVGLTKFHADQHLCLFLHGYGIIERDHIGYDPIWKFNPKKIDWYKRSLQENNDEMILIMGSNAEILNLFAQIGGDNPQE